MEAALLLNDVKPGVKFVDPRLTTSPPSYRAYVVKAVQGFELFTAVHVHSGRERKFPLRDVDVDPLVMVGKFPIVQNNLDVFVGDRVRLELTDGGSLHGKVTAVHYAEVNIDGAVARHVAGIEIDHSSSSTYGLHQIKRLIRVGGAL